MIRVGLTGGIGSGKSTVASFFRELGAPVYDSDRRAKELMNVDTDLREAITALLGTKADKDGSLNRQWIAGRVFSDPELLSSLNALVHPAVREDFNLWSAAQKAPYVLQEAAILMENRGNKHLDRTILVTARESVRIARVVERDDVQAADVRERMENQWKDSDKIPLADFVIENTNLENTRRQVEDIHRELLQLSGAGDESFC